MPNQGITFRGGINVLKRFLIGGTEVTATAAEINTACDGVTASAAELNVLDGVTPGTVTAGKAVVTTTNKHIDAIVISDGGLALGAGAGTAVTATAAELNYTDITTLGTVQASKAVTADANLDTTGFRNITATGTVTVGDVAANDATLDIAGKAATSAGNGGAVALAAGQAHTNGNGGAISVIAGAGSATGTGAGGAASLVAGASGGGATGNGGAVSVTGGAAVSTDGTGGAASVTGGAGKGAANGGAASVTGGLGGDGATGNGGASNLVGGAAASTDGDGGDVAITGGAATGTGTGGDVSIASGASAGATGTAGSITVDTGDPATGTGGTIAIGGTNATDVAIGRVAGTVTLRGTGLTATATELNTLASVAAGTASASKAVVLGATKNLDTLAVAKDGLLIGASGAEVAMTCTSAELNVLDGITASTAILNQADYDAGAHAKAVIDFNTGAAEAACSVTINGVVYQEADVEDFPNGVWTNGASAADSATSFAAAVNGDTRAAVPMTAVVSTVGDSVHLLWDAVGTAGNVTITTTSATRVTVENSTGGAAAARKRIYAVNYEVTAQDVLADEVIIPVPFAPVAWIENAKDATGLAKAHTGLVNVAHTPERIVIDNTAGVTHLAATDIVSLVVFG